MYLPRRYTNQKPDIGAEVDRNHEIGSSVVGCWLMQEGTGIWARDISGFDNHGTLTNGPTWVPGENGWAINFSPYGTAARILVNNPEKIGGEVAISFVVSVYMSNIDQYSRFWDKVGHSTLYLDTDTGRLFFGLYFSGIGWRAVNSSDGAIVTNNSYTIVCTWGAISRYMYIYINGILNNSFNLGPSVALPLNSNDFSIGNHATLDRSLPGRINYFNIFNRALLPAEIQELYYNPYCFIKQPRRVIYSIPGGQVFNIAENLDIAKLSDISLAQSVFVTKSLDISCLYDVAIPSLIFTKAVQDIELLTDDSIITALLAANSNDIQKLVDNSTNIMSILANSTDISKYFDVSNITINFSASSLDIAKLYDNTAISLLFELNSLDITKLYDIASPITLFIANSLDIAKLLDYSNANLDFAVFSQDIAKLEDYVNSTCVWQLVSSDIAKLVDNVGVLNQIVTNAKDVALLTENGASTTIFSLFAGDIQKLFDLAKLSEDIVLKIITVVAESLFQLGVTTNSLFKVDITADSLFSITVTPE